MKQRKNNRFLAMLMAMLMIVSTVATGWYPVVAKADTNTGITCFVLPLPIVFITTFLTEGVPL